MNLWFGKAAFIIGFFAIGHFRDPHIKKNKTIKVAEDRKTLFDISLIAIVTLGGVILPLVWMLSSLLSFADYPLYPPMFIVGVGLLVFSLWLFKRSHDDLGTNWSVSLQVKENHRIITTGIYKSIRHPMYSALFLYSAAQTFLLPNWIVGPAGVITFTILYFGRVGAEERMMLDRFGDEYKVYMRSTKRLIPGVGPPTGSL